MNWFVVRNLNFQSDFMANTYTQIYVQVVFAVEARQCLIRSKFKEELHKYIAMNTSRF